MPWRADGGPGDPGLVTCERAREWLDPLLDGDLPRPAEEALDAHLAGCADCRSELAMARRLREAIRQGLPMLSCPPAVTQEVLRIAREEAAAAPSAGPRREAPAGWVDRLAGWVAGSALRPALVAAAFVVLVVAAPLLYRAVTSSSPGASPTDRPIAAETTGPTYSPAEVAAAEEQARLVLAYVASVGRDAGRAVQEEVLEPGIGRPTRRVVAGLEAAGLAPAPEAPPGASDSTERNRP